MKRKILIIEDDPDVRANLVSLLTEEGYGVIAVKNGIDGIVTAREEKPDLILCDIMMEGKNGFEVLQELLTDIVTKTIPFIFLTAKAERNDIRHGMQLGADDYLIKPYDLNDLLQSIETRLKKSDVLHVLSAKKGHAPKEESFHPDDTIIVQIGNASQAVKIKDIVSITANRQYTLILFANKETSLVRKSLNYWQEILPANSFFRVHRSSIINLEFIRKTEKLHNAGFYIYLKDIKDPIIVSRSYAQKFRKKMVK
ncbi:MAG: response regulator [Ignavibacteria bacterium]|nr:response regulator [Ignavibacteria bacterium]